ncbi:MAG TPA: hypothetical protein DHW34_00735 [Actinobacteria bacterium]|nr:hypothetical protein [Actinomycetota bacterium]
MTRGSGLRRAALMLAVCATLAGVANIASPAHAADNGAWSASPTQQGTFTARQFFFLELAPGATIKDSITIKNAGQVDQPLDIYTADAFNIESGAGFALRKRGDKNTDVGSWITLDQEKVVVGPNGGKTIVPFSLTVPRGVTPGDHAGGVVTIEPAPAPQGDVSQVQIQRALGVRVYVRVAGPLTPALSITKVTVSAKPARLPFVGQQGGTTVTYTVRNSGNVRLTADREITLKGLFGRTLRNTGKGPIPEILPGSTVTLTESFPKAPVIDQITATVKLTAADGKVSTSGSASTFVVSLAFLILLALLIIGIVLAVWWRRREAGLVAKMAQEAGPLTPTGDGI